MLRKYLFVSILFLMISMPFAVNADMITAAVPVMPAVSTAAPDELTREISRIRIENRVSGNISYSLDGGRNWTVVGSVIVPDTGNIHTITDEEFTAADWAPLGAVAATAVNAIHLKGGQAEKHAQAFSVFPKEIYVSTTNQSYYTEEAAIFTDIAAGTGIFSVPMAPRVGDALYKESTDGTLHLWQQGDLPAVSENIVIISRDISKDIEWVEFDNYWGGYVRLHKGGRDYTIARVYRPFKGTGRFGGTQFQSVSLVRANHPGVICVSTSPKGETGGFQIVPCFHANEKTLDYVSTVTAYMVIGPLDETSAALEGTAPLYLHTFRPGDRAEVKINGVWGSIPSTSGLKSEALKSVEAVRLYPSHNN